MATEANVKTEMTPGLYLFGEYLGRPNKLPDRLPSGFTVVGRVCKRWRSRWMTDAEYAKHCGQ